MWLRELAMLGLWGTVVGCVDKASEEGRACPCSDDRTCCFGECVSGDDACVVEQTIGLGGGTLTASDGTSLEVPFGALEKDTIIRLRSAPGTQVPDGITVLGDAVVIEPEALQLRKTAILSIPYDVDRIPQGTDLDDVLVHSALSGTMAFQRLFDTEVQSTVMRVGIRHFTLFLPAISERCPYLDDLGCGGFELAVGGTTYGVECSEDTPITTCRCLENGTATKTVETLCNGNANGFGPAIYTYECEFPCPDEPPPLMPDAGPTEAG